MNTIFNGDGSATSNANSSFISSADGSFIANADGSFTSNADGSFTSNADGSIRLRLLGHTLSLLPARALFWHERRTLIVADIHLGKAQTFQRAGIAIPGHSLDDDLQRLTNVITKTQARHLLVLGDFVHHRSGLTQRVQRKIKKWCAALGADITLILGNHDQPNTAFLKTLPIRLVQNHEQTPFTFTHDSMPKIPNTDERFVFMGHLHPIINFRGSNIRLPAFAFYEHHCVLPAFSYFTGGWVTERKGLRAVFGVVDGVKVWANADGHLQSG
ncbi:MAG TPA: ligase-associated DNA damage response endonuclease PdeM [Cellvibrionaceae bacterium]